MFEDTIMKSFLTISGSVIVIGLFLFLLKKVSKKSKIMKSIVDFKVITKIPLQPKTNLYIVKAAEKTLLIGVTDHSISTLADLTDDLKKGIDSDTVSAKFANSAQVSGNEKIPVSEDGSTSFRTFLKTSFKKYN